jgi:hypothetical protein
VGAGWWGLHETGAGSPEGDEDVFAQGVRACLLGGDQDAVVVESAVGDATPPSWR